MAGKGTVTYTLRLDAKDFQSGIKVATKEFEGFVSSLSQGAGSLGKVASAMGPVGVAAAAAMGVASAGVLAFGKATLDAGVAAVDFAGKISDLSTKTGISGVALQKLGFAGDMVGTSLETTTNAIAKMQQHLVKAPEDLKQLGLSFETIKNLSPEKQFEAIGKKILSIEDPAQRTAATMAFFGKSGQEALKVLSAGLDEVGDRAEHLGNVMSDSTREALDSLGDSAKVLQTTWEHLLMNFGGAIAEMPEVKQAVDAITEALGEMSRFVLANKSDIQALVKIAIVPMADAVVDLLHAVQFLVSGLISLKNAVSGGWLERMAKALAPSAFGSSGSSGVGQGSGLSATSRIVEPKNQKPPGWIDPAILKKNADEALRIQTLADQTMAKIRVDAIKTVNAQLEGEYRRNVRVIEQMLDDWVEEERQAAEAVKQIKEALKQDGEAFMKSWAEQQRREFEQMMQSLEDVQMLGDAIANLGDVMGSGFITNIGLAASGWAEFSKQAALATTNAQKATVAIQAASSAVAGKSVLGGAAKGAAAGAMFGPYGVAIGAVAGGILGFIGKKKAQGKELAELNAELKRVQAEATAAGLKLNVAFNPKNAQSMKQAIDELNKALGLQSAATDALHDAMDRYGISIGQLGPEFAKQELDKQAAQLLQDYSLLNAAGVDHNTILQQMGPNLNAYVQQSLAAGTAIPESMRPIIQGLIDQGLLLDQNGQAYTSVEQAGISFTATMSEQFGTLISKINDLVSALLGIPNINRTITVERRYTGGGGGDEDGGRDGDPATPLASGFEGMVTRPRKFLVGEAGPEYMSVRKAGDKGGFDLGGLESKLDGLRDDFRRYQQAQAGSIRDAVLLGRA